MQATVTDSRVPHWVGTDSVSHYKPALAAAYDYYPFGMLMPGRHVQDTSGKCMTVTANKWMTKMIGECYDQSQWPWPGFSGTGISHVYPNGTDLELAVNGYIEFEFPVIPNKAYRLRYEVTTDWGGGTGIVSVLHNVGGGMGTIGSDYIGSPGMTEIVFTPSSNYIVVKFNGNFDVDLRQLCLDRYEPGLYSVLVDVCNEKGDKYPFGFNGQEKINEMSGVGNHNTALFWEYDTRTGRRWNVDPIVKPWRSSYDAFDNSPILKIDPNGDDDFLVNSRGYIKPIKPDKNSLTDRLIYGNKIRFNNKTGEMKNDFSVLDKGIIKNRIEYENVKEGGKGWKMDFKKNVIKAQEVYDKLRKNGIVEFAIVKVKLKDGQRSNAVYTSHDHGKEANSDRGISRFTGDDDYIKNNVESIEHRHSHPNSINGGSSGPSELDEKAVKKYEKYDEKIKHYIDDQNTKTPVEY